MKPLNREPWNTKLKDHLTGSQVDKNPATCRFIFTSPGGRHGESSNTEVQCEGLSLVKSMVDGIPDMKIVRWEAAELPGPILSAKM